ncbi:pilus assembly protein TadG-related protein [Mesorhizobium sp. 10J20-29]
MLSVRSFLHDVKANIGVLMGLAALPIALSIGVATDYARGVSARSHLQELADATALTLAGSGQEEPTKLAELAKLLLPANQARSKIDSVSIVDLKASGSSVYLQLQGRVHATFMGLAGITHLDVKASAMAERAIMGSVEVVLVLDNTWSMSTPDSTGTPKIATLKTAAASLVTELLKNKDASVRIGLVPYADFVNVGTNYRNASWIDVPEDYTKPATTQTCTTSTTRSVCVQKAPTYACTKSVDGVLELSTCGGACTKSVTQDVPPYQACSGGGSAQTYTWFGCVGSRQNSDSRLHDEKPADRYPGFLDTSQKCLNPIVPLTDDLKTLLAGINGMIINIGSYKPYTYIPAGLIWGQNLLSRTQPFAQGAAYDPSNKSPRKVAVLMTDGENTLRFRNSDGRHVMPSSNATTAKGELKKTDDDTVEICDYMKSHQIEIYTVAFMVTDPETKAMLEDCAAVPRHYFDASDAAKLLSAFSGIAQSLAQVRLVR